MCKWKNSTEVKPCAHWYTFSSTTSSGRADLCIPRGSRMQLTCSLTFSHSPQILVWLKMSRPKLYSQPCSPSKASIRFVTILVISELKPEFLVRNRLAWYAYTSGICFHMHTSMIFVLTSRHTLTDLTKHLHVILQDFLKIILQLCSTVYNDNSETKFDTNHWK